MFRCDVCGNVDSIFDESSKAAHHASPRHICNKILCEYRENKQKFVKNKDGILIFCNARYLDSPDNMVVEKCDQLKTRMFARPKQQVMFSFHISSELKDQNVLIVGIQLAHPQPHFQMNNHGYVFGEAPHVLKPKSSVKKNVSVIFEAVDIGQFEMPIMFTFQRENKKPLIFIREMVVRVQEDLVYQPFEKSPYTDEIIYKVKETVNSVDHTPYERAYKIAKPLKTLFALALNVDSIEKLNISEEKKNELKAHNETARYVLDEGITEDNYRMYFHYLLWWEETLARINLRKYNMKERKLELLDDGTFWLEVPGLAEKRPSLLRGDRVFLLPTEDIDIRFEGIINDIHESRIGLGQLDERFYEYYNENATFNVQFLMSRVPMERMHVAVDQTYNNKQLSRIFPVPANKKPKVQPISKFYNNLVKENDEQRSAVEHIVSKACGLTPYIVFGPPGTGKTMTIVEAIIQIVVKNPNHRVLVCTDSNMAADHITLMLLKYEKKLNINNFIKRANSQNREWSIMPPEVQQVSNGKDRDSFYPLFNDDLMNFRVVVATLLHSAKYGSDWCQNKCKLKMSHLFIDEAAQALEPAALVPISGLLAANGQLVLSGDPQQLGPVCFSKDASVRGLGKSLLERLFNTHDTIYRDNPNYITTLVQNYRSDPDILEIPNKLFYREKPLQPRAKLDPLSKVSILSEHPGGDRAMVFHSVNSREMRMGNAPSFFNEVELAMLRRYTRELVHKHQVPANDIGIISPYIRQVYKVRDWLKANDYEAIDVGTVESFQGKEKRVILVSTVRANCRLLEYDANFKLGFLVDDKRFNVALTRAKAKLVVIGNRACLAKDLKWRLLMDFCKERGCYLGQDSENLERTIPLLVEVSQHRFRKCKLDEYIKAAMEQKEKEKKTQR